MIVSLLFILKLFHWKKNYFCETKNHLDIHKYAFAISDALEPQVFAKIVNNF